MGLTHLEFNKVGEKGVHELSADDVAELRRMVAGEGLQVVAVDPPSFKAIELDEVPVAEVTGHPAVAEHLEQIRRSCEVAGELGAGIVRLFSFRRGYMAGAGNPSPREPRGGAIPDELLPRIVAGLRAAAAIAEEHGVTLGLENVRSCWGNTGHNAARILGAVDHPRLRAIWDPGNDFVSGGVPYPDGYRARAPLPPARARQGRRGGGRRHRTDELGSDRQRRGGLRRPDRRPAPRQLLGRRQRGDPLAQGWRLTPRIHPRDPRAGCDPSCSCSRGLRRVYTPRSR